MSTIEVDIVIPVYNERENIGRVLDSFKASMRFKYRVLICYDNDDDNTLLALKNYPLEGFQMEYVKNQGSGVLGAVMTGLGLVTAPAVIVFPADDDINAPRLNHLYEKFKEGCDIVVASRFMKGGNMVGCPLVKEILVRAAGFMLHRIALVPTHDPTNGLRLFSRRLIRTIHIESRVGFAFSIEYLVKAHRLGLKIDEAPFSWIERQSGKSRFRTLRWIPQYSRWLFYALATTWLFHSSRTVQWRD
jgi:glycosyltransferase involved in cell wall biosynthesis